MPGIDGVARAARSFARDSLLPMTRAVALLWAAPLSLVGVAAALLARVTGGRMRRVDHTLEASGGLLATLLPRMGVGMRPVAITVGQVILAVDQAALDRLRVHERVHVAQGERWGALFPIAYLAASLMAWGRGEDVYQGNLFEREAREAERLIL